VDIVAVRICNWEEATNIISGLEEFYVSIKPMKDQEFLRLCSGQAFSSIKTK
jgi:hypothetical protein